MNTTTNMNTTLFEKANSVDATFHDAPRAEPLVFEGPCWYQPNAVALPSGEVIVDACGEDDCELCGPLGRREPWVAVYGVDRTHVR
jgi:hypothetical protein